jgi:oligopeptide/dipeptide ABC transporter ATP-binding protein
MTTPLPSAPLVRVDDLHKVFAARGGLFGHGEAVHAVNGVTLEIQPGEVLGLVGESGCGKSTLGRLILRLLEPTSGTISFNGVDITRYSHSQLAAVRREMGVIFQDPYASLNPLMTVESILTEPLRAHRVLTRGEWGSRVRDLLELVGLPTSALGRKPAQFSGGQQQRIAIARALALNPKLIVADEALSSLDVSIQAQILNLFLEIQDLLGISYMFISHNLAVVRHISHRVAVMYLGKIVETAAAEHLYSTPRHPYTQALLSALPIADPDIERARQRIVLSGDPASPTRIPPGCPLHPRCWLAVERCSVEVPELRELGAGHFAACHLAEPTKVELDPGSTTVPQEKGAGDVGRDDTDSDPSVHPRERPSGRAARP